jgi:hypothetical protein
LGIGLLALTLLQGGVAPVWALPTLDSSPGTGGFIRLPSTEPSSRTPNQTPSIKVTPIGKSSNSRALSATATALSAQVFARLNIPVGIATASSNVFASGCDSLCLNSIVSKYAPSGSLLGSVRTGGITSFAGYLARDPVYGNIWELKSDGTILAINPSTGASGTILRLRSLQVDTSSIFDLATRRVSNFGGLIQPQSANYGDLAIVQRNGVRYIFIAGLSSANTFPFVMRLRIQGNTIVEAKVVASSRASTAGSVNLTRGVAVNPQGTVLTTLPTATSSSGTFDVPVAFGADYNPRTGAGGSPRVVLNGIDLASQGMTTDSAGNFYVATNSVGSAALGTPGVGTLVVIPPALTSVRNGITLGGTGSSLRDVTFDPTNGRVYTTLAPLNYVVSVTGL